MGIHSHVQSWDMMFAKGTRLAEWHKSMTKPYFKGSKIPRLCFLTPLPIATESIYNPLICDAEGGIFFLFLTRKFIHSSLDKNED